MIVKPALLPHSRRRLLRYGLRLSLALVLVIAVGVMYHTVSAGGTAPVSSSSPSSSTAAPQFYTLPNGNAARQAAAWRSARPHDAARMQRLAAIPTSQWFGDWNADVRTDVDTYVSAAARAKRIPLMVVYNIPGRDCGGFSGGGAGSPSAYAAWLQKLAAGIGKRNAVVIVEPDALAGLDCLSAARKEERYRMLRGAVTTLRTMTSAKVYLDAGNPTWHPAADIAPRLIKADVAHTAGFSLNVSNFQTTESNVAYGAAIYKLTGGAHYIIDTSRNGNGPTSDFQWCNPPGRALGAVPSLRTGLVGVDAYIWAKDPGGSDGPCGSNIGASSPPEAGTWWPEYALEITKNSGW